jgi:hypothetical protein
MPLGADDAAEAVLFSPDAIPDNMAFDHSLIIGDYIQRKY